MNFRITQHPDGLRRRITLLLGDRPMAIASLSEHEHQQLRMQIVTEIAKIVTEQLRNGLQEMLWRDAQAQRDGNAEMGKKLLEEFGWGPEKIEQYVGHLATLIVSELIDRTAP